MTQTIDDALLDEEWLAAPVKRSRLRMILAGLLAASLCFLGGALVQKHYGAGSAGGAAGGLPAGFPGGGSGGFPGGGAFPGGDPGTGTGTDTGTGTGSSSAPSGGTGDVGDDSTAVIGKVVEVNGDTWVVEDLGGKRHTIKLADDTDVIREEKLQPADVKTGDTVNITGKTDDGGVSADKVIVR